MTTAVVPRRQDRAARRVFITGATGCIGRYIVEDLLAETDDALVLLVRNPSRLPAELREHPRVSVLEARLQDAASDEAISLGSADVAVLAAAEWGPDPLASEVNVAATLALARRLSMLGCQHIVYFATASILDYDHAPLPEALTLGTPYIKSKAECLRALREGAVTAPLTILYPTLVLGGGERGIPRSHFSGLLREIERRRQVVRFVRADGSFHAIHAADIARIVKQLVRHKPTQQIRSLVLGGTAVTVDEAVDALCELFGVRRRRLFSLRPPVVSAAVRLFGIQLADWDRYCLTRAHFTHRAPTMPEDFAASSVYPALPSLLASALATGRSSSGRERERD